MRPCVVVSSDELNAHLRTTLSDNDNDVLAAAKELARQQKQSIGKLKEHNWFPLLPIRPDGGPVDLQLVNSLSSETDRWRRYR